MLNDTEIKRNIREATTPRLLTASTSGRGSGVLRLRIRPGARQTSAVWIASWKQDGRRGTKQLGKYPDMTLAAARRLYEDEVAPLVSAGKTPRRAPVMTAEGKPTVERMFQGYVNALKAAGKVSHTEVERALLTGSDNAADALGRNVLVSNVDADDVVAYVATIFNRGARSSADKARSYIGSAFNWAIKSEHDYTAKVKQCWGLKMNPAASLRKDGGAVRPRDRNLSAAELAALWNAQSGFEQETLDFLRVVIATGQRVQECRRMAGADVALNEMVWSMPALKTKGRKRRHAIPLPASIIPTLVRLKAEKGQGPLFDVRVCSVMRAITRWTEREDVDVAHFQTRDLRRTWKSRTGEAGVDDFMRDVIQQHARGGTGAIFYDRADYRQRMREAMDKWDEWLCQNVLRGA